MYPWSDDGAPKLISLVEAADKKVCLLYIDCASNPTVLGAGILFGSPEGHKIEKFFGGRTHPYNNGFQLLVGHVKGDFKINEAKESLVGYLWRVRNLARLFRSCHMEHVPRERNYEADSISPVATVEYGTLSGSAPVEWVVEEVFLTIEVMDNALEGKR
ncbi:hypothetical protein LIER_34644 [Lithospermum erythrorhizon]|uniref:RNase H type-1 domain-containing protein n=1 Tax=Lithospermum erythrorhizon TaxID=34254 RepID=A0AAV3S030_LITER